MSDAGEAAITAGSTVVGGGIGFVLGGWGGALRGAALGFQVGQGIWSQSGQKQEGEGTSATYSLGGIDLTKSHRLPIPVVYGQHLVAGNVIYEDVYGDEEQNLDIIVALSEGPINNVSDIKANEVEVPTSAYEIKYGTADQTPSSVKSDGYYPYTAYIAASLDAEELELSGAPTLTSLVEGRKIRTWDANNSTWVTQYSNNPAYVLLDFLTNDRYGLGVDDEIIELESFKAVADWCDSEGYETNLVLDRQQTSLDIIETILQTFQSFLIYSGGKLRLIADTVEDTTAQTFNMDNIIEGSFSYEQVSGDNKPNRVTAEYVEPQQNWEMVDAIYSNDRDIEERGKVIEENIQLKGVTNFDQAGQLTRIFHNKSFYNTFLANWKAGVDSLHCEPGDIVEVSHDLPGWSNKKFRIMQVKETDNEEMNIFAQEYNPQVYSSQGISYQPPDGPSLPNPNDPPPHVESVTLNEQRHEDKDGSNYSTILADWNRPSGYPYYTSCQVYMKKSSESWGGTPVGRSEGTLYETDRITTGDYDLKFVAVNRAGLKADFASAPTASITVEGKNAAPPDVEFLEGRFDTQISLKWTPVSAPDLDYYEVRTDKNWGNTDASLVFRGDDNKFEASKDELPLGGEAIGTRDYTFYIKAKNDSGIWSTNNDSINVTNPAPDPPNLNITEFFEKFWVEVIPPESTTSYDAKPTANNKSIQITDYSATVTAVSPNVYVSVPFNEVQVNEYPATVSSAGTFNNEKSLTVTSDGNSTSMSKPVPLKITSGDDTTTGTGEIVLDWTNISSKADIAVYDSSGTIRDYTFEKFDTTNEEAIIWVYGSWVRDGTEQARIAYGSGPEDKSSTESTVFDQDTNLNAQYLLNESSGDFSDSTSNNWTANNNGASYEQSAMVGDGTYTDGSSTYFTSGGIIESTNFTISFWLNTPIDVSNQDDWAKIIDADSQSDSYPSNYYIQYHDTNELVAGFGNANGFHQVLSGYTPPQNTWVRVTYTYDGSTLRLYANGTEQGSNSFSETTDPTTTFTFGTHHVEDKKFSEQYMDNIRILSENEDANIIQALYDAEKQSPDFFSQGSSGSSSLSSLSYQEDDEIRSLGSSSYGTIQGFEIEVDDGSDVETFDISKGERLSYNAQVETSYDVRARAYDIIGPGSWSAIYTATTKSIDKLSQFTKNLRPIDIVDSLPSLPDDEYPEGCLVVLTTDSKVYENVGGSWEARSVETPVDTDDIADGAIDLSKYTTNTRPVQIVSSLPSLPNEDYPDGAVVYNESDGKIYRNDSGSWTADVGQDDFAGSLEPIDVVDSLPNPSGYDGPKTVFLTTDSKLYRYDSSVPEWTKAVDDSDFAGSLEPIDVVSSLPSPSGYDGPKTVYNTSDNKLYRYDSSVPEWTSTVPAGDLTGSITETQITDDAVTTPKVNAGAITASEISTGTITASEISSGTITAGEISSGTITATEISGNTITASEIASDTIEAGQISAGTITASEISSGTITAGEISSGTITAGEISSGTITASEIATDAITATEIDAYTITASEISSDTITANEIAVGTITASEIASDSITSGVIKAGAITATEISAGTIGADEIGAGEITATEIAANTITADQISGDTITASEIDSNVITATEISGNTITASEIDAGTITANEISFGTITGDEIDAGTITANEISFGTITGDEISSGSIDTDELSSNSVTATEINVTDLSAVNADLGTVTAGKMYLSSGDIEIGGGALSDGSDGIYINNGGLEITDGTGRIIFDNSGDFLPLPNASQLNSATDSGRMDGYSWETMLTITDSDVILGGQVAKEEGDPEDMKDFKVRVSDGSGSATISHPISLNDSNYSGYGSTWRTGDWALQANQLPLPTLQVQGSATLEVYNSAADRRNWQIKIWYY